MIKNAIANMVQLQFLTLFLTVTGLNDRGKYFSLFPALVQGKVFNFEELREEFGGSEPEKGRKFISFADLWSKI